MSVFNKQPTTLDVTGSTQVKLVLRNMREVQGMPTSASYINTLPGLLKPKTLTCGARMGDEGKVFSVRLDKAPKSSLVVSCVIADILRLTNNGGKCVQAWSILAKQVHIRGNNTVEAHFSPESLPSVIELKNMTSRADVNSVNATRVILQFSTHKAHGDLIKPGAVKVTGNVRFAVPETRAAVVLVGCGVDKIAVDVKDANGVDAYRVVNICRDTQLEAMADLRGVRQQPPCSRFAQ